MSYKKASLRPQIESSPVWYPRLTACSHAAEQLCAGSDLLLQITGDALHWGNTSRFAETRVRPQTAAVGAAASLAALQTQLSKPSSPNAGGHEHRAPAPAAPAAASETHSEPRPWVLHPERLWEGAELSPDSSPCRFPRSLCISPLSRFIRPWQLSGP